MYFSFNKHKYIFEPKVFSTFVSLVALLILLSLSYWQIIRLEWKENLIEQRIKMFESDSVFLKNVEYPEKNEFLRVKIEGKFINELEMFMPALSKNGNNGYHILLPFELVNGEYIIFDRGWIPLKLKNRELRKKHEIYDSQKIEAVIRLPGKKGKFQPDNDVENNFWFFVEPLKMSEFTKLNFRDTFYLEATNDGPNGYPLGNQTRIYIRNNHLQYAITWFLIAIGLVGVYLAANIRKIK
jgi:surfeit locus 1 family protein